MIKENASKVSGGLFEFCGGASTCPTTAIKKKTERDKE